ncbi:MAG: glycosyltransferase family 4 protein [Gammaproteobacteria bacterium]|nr:glycosyltransferase family 4 protein [Gammaproteobacteria bacterium]MYJ53002.1 glycosyltransferase family 4 protein [Gammaproteobacteria bacterium]
MKIGFYAPMKPPGHPVPSGDRKMARLLIELLDSIGHEVVVLSTLRSWEGRGDRRRQQDIRHAANLELERLKRDDASRDLDLVFVYHVYHKAPDWIGLDLAGFLGVPYLVAEASFAPRQAGGRWAEGHERARACIRSADAILCLNPADENCLRDLVAGPDILQRILPFTSGPDSAASTPDRKAVVCRFPNLDADAVWLACAAMMRSGDKLRSYRELSAVLEMLPGQGWNLIVIGDGPARREVERLFSKMATRCLFVGELEDPEVGKWLDMADLYVWPSVNEAFGLALLEAVSHDLPALAYDYGGVGAIIEDGANGFLVPAGERTLFAGRLQSMISDQAARERMRSNARRKFFRDHRFQAARSRVADILDRVLPTARRGQSR